MKEKKVEEKIYNIINHQLNHNMLSHAYLIEANHYDDIENVIKKIAKLILCDHSNNHNEHEKCTTCHLIDSNQCIDFKMVFPDGNFIKKDQLLDIKKLFKTTSASPYRIYAIFQADKLNAASANTILKFLEEPEPGIIAFLVADNRYQVLETLVSRCQILTLHSSVMDTLDENTLEFLRKITTDKYFYLDFKELLEVYLPNKEIARKTLDDIEIYLHQLLLSRTQLMTEVPSSNLFTNLSKDSIIKYISILEEEKQKLVYNVNYRLWFHHLLVRFMEVVG